MSIDVTVSVGDTTIAGTNVDFGIVSDVASAVWDFGDGATAVTSANRTVRHLYPMSGKYSWSASLTYNTGDVGVEGGSLYVREWDYPNDKFHVAYVDECYRIAVMSGQGIGTVPWGGDSWLYPTAYNGTCKAKSKNGMMYSVVSDNRNGRFYQIGVDDLWVDREDDYGGSEILCMINLKEHVA